MKILKQGKLPDKPIDTIHTVSCDVCDSKIEFNISEITHSYEDHTYLITCPFCNKNIWMSSFSKIYHKYNSKLSLYKSTHPKG